MKRARAALVWLATAAVFGVLLPGAGAAPPGPEGHRMRAIPTRTYEVTLITGDVVRYTVFSDGSDVAAVLPDDPSPALGYRSFEMRGDLYVVPFEAQPYLNADRLDLRLFNLTDLVEAGYSDGARRTLPLIVTYAPAAPTGTAARATRSGLDPVGAVRALPSVDGIAVAEPKHDLRNFWSEIARSAPTARSFSSGTGVDKVWLDGRTQATLHESVPMIGAPGAWDVGLDGTGVDVAVLDTGIDLSHPDFAGRIGETRSFTSDGTIDDRIGHGTHVASIVAGSGARAEGLYKGVAPGAELMVGKVLGDDGFGLDSWVIDGMEWAAGRGAEVVNLSLGSPATDGTDPVSLSLNALTRSTGTIYVVAAGNDGPGALTVASPAAADEALAVGNVDKTGALAFSSSRGPRIGDNAIKPEIVAPGTDIVAARAEATALGAPVGDHYTRLTGTSMAAPHVAGAAALLAQKHPEWNANQLKAVLASTAVAYDDLTVYEQGAGLVRADRAVDATVFVDRGELDLGYFPWPHEDGPTTTERTVSYRNAGDEPVTLELAASMTSDDGTVFPQHGIDVVPSTVTLAPGESRSVRLRVDVSVAPTGNYGGALTATGEGVELRTALGVYKQGDMIDVKISARDVNGEPAAAQLTLLNYHIDPWEPYGYIPITLSAGQTRTLRIPRGAYSLLGLVYTLDGSGTVPLEVTVGGDPQIGVQRNLDITVDARDAVPLRVDTGRDTDVPSLVLGWIRGAEGRNAMLDSYVLLPAASGLRRISAIPTERVTDGNFDFFSIWNLSAPWVRMWAGRHSPLHPVVMPGAPRFDGRRHYEVVDAGRGGPDDIHDARGKVALMEQSAAVTFTEQASAAAERGAALALIYPDRPGELRGVAFGAPIPTLTLPRHEALDLLADLDSRGRHHRSVVEVEGVENSPFTYDLSQQEAGAIGRDLRYDIDRRDVAAIDTHYSATAPDDVVFDSRWPVEPCRCSLTRILGRVEAPFQRTEFVSANGSVWRKLLSGLGLFLNDVETSYRRGDRLREEWFEAPYSPGMPTGSRADAESFVPVRTGNEMTFRMANMTDSEPRHWGAGNVQATGALYGDGELLHSFDFAIFGTVAVPPGRRAYRLELDVTRGGPGELSPRTHTEWTFDSTTTVDPQALPLLDVDYELEVDDFNTASSRKSQDVRLRVRRGGDGFDFRARTALLWVSYDEGESWRHVGLQRKGAQFRARLRGDKDGAGSYVSLRVRALDDEGNAIDQTILRAAELR